MTPTNLCPLCRRSMRYWALDVRTISNPEERHYAIATAIGYRDECLHTDREKYDALVAKLNQLPMKASTLSLAIWREVERIKNLHGGNKPVGRTFHAWRSRPSVIRTTLQEAA